MTSYSPCFRKEIGSHGLEERGLYRVHQFEKQEMIVLCEPEESMEWYNKMWKLSVDLFRSWNVPVRQLDCCSGDLADLKVKSCDIEAWSPRQQKYFEVCSCSNLGDAQARRLGIRVKSEKGNYYLHTLNNTVVATPRGLIAVIENNYNEDGSVTIPEVLDTHGRASMTATEAMKYSSNIGLSEIILRGYERNPDEFVQRIYKSGFMEPFDLCIPGAARPTIRHLKSTVQDRINLTRMSYGYTTKIPPIYTLALYNTIANDGQFVKPRLVKELIRDGVTDTVFDISYIRKQACKPETARALRNMLYAVVNDDDGTGRRARSKKVTIAGKTGTVRTIGSDGKYETRYRITFCGFFPYENPQYSCIVLLGKPNLPGMPSAGYYCGGVLKKIAETLYSMGRLDVPMDIPSDSTSVRSPAILKGDIAETRQVLQCAHRSRR